MSDPERVSKETYCETCGYPCTCGKAAEATPSGGGETRVIKVFRIVSKNDAFVSKLGPHIVDAAMAKELFKQLCEAIPQGPCLFDWKIEHHTVDELDESGRRWPGAKEGDVVVQGYIRYQLPKGE